MFRIDRKGMNHKDAVIFFRKEEYRPCLVCTLNPWYTCRECGFKLCEYCRSKAWKALRNEDAPSYRCMGDVWFHFAKTSCPYAKSLMNYDDGRA